MGKQPFIYALIIIRFVSIHCTYACVHSAILNSYWTLIGVQEMHGVITRGPPVAGNLSINLGLLDNGQQIYMCSLSISVLWERY